MGPGVHGLSADDRSQLLEQRIRCSIPRESFHSARLPCPSHVSRPRRIAKKLAYSVAETVRIVGVYEEACFAMIDDVRHASYACSNDWHLVHHCFNEGHAE